MPRGLPTSMGLIVKSELDPGEGAIDTGKRIMWGNQERIVYAIEDEETKLVPQMDPLTQRPRYRTGPQGQTLNSYHTERVPTGRTRRREFILDNSMGIGITQRIWKGWQSNPEDERRKEEKEKIDRMQRELATALVREGVSVSDLVRAVKGRAEVEPTWDDESPPPPEPEPDPEPQQSKGKK